MSSKTNLTSQKPSTLWRTSYSPPTSEPAPSMPASPWVVKPSKTSVISWQVIQPMSSINIIVTAVRVNFSVKTILNVGLFFLSIPIPGFVPSDRFAWNGPVRLSFTDRRNSSQARQTPPVGRSENLTGPSFLLQWSSATKPCIFRQHYRAKKESFIE